MRRLADLAHNRPRRVLLIAFACALVAAALGGSVAERLDPYGAEDPATESSRAVERLERAGGIDPHVGLVALIETPGPVASSAGRAKVEQVADLVASDAAVGRVTTTFTTRDPALVSKDGRSTYIVANFAPVSDKEQQEASERVQERLAGVEGVSLGGPGAASAQINETVAEDLTRAELIAFPALFILSLIFFRGAVAALLPPLVGGLAIVGTFFALRLASEMGSISVFALNLTTGLGLGLAIDYSLFIVSRYREEIARTGPGREALRRTLATAGRTVLFSSLTVSAALASLLVFPQRFLYSMGLGGMIVALIAAAVALLVLPAILALLGNRVNALAPRRLQRAAEREAAPDSAGAWYRLSRLVMRRPGRVAIVSGAVLIALGTPFLGIRLTAVDASVLPEEASARQVDTALKRDFPPNHEQPILLAVDAPAGVAVNDFAAGLRDTPGVAAVLPAERAGSGTSLVRVVPDQGFLEERSQSLVRELRQAEAPFDVLVGGGTAEFVDQKSSLASHLPLVFTIIAAATILVLFLMTGSIVLPIKALVMNVLTLSATFGLLVLIFQDGRFEGLLDYTSQGALESSQPVLLFAVAFGLSTDYGVFLLSRIKEARDAGASDSEAVAVGLERTGRIVTAAAVLFAVAFGAFATSQIIFIKEVGVGTALAVLIDASIIRAFLVPSLMELLGSRNWWAPRPLARLYERFGLREGDARVARAPGAVKA